MPFENMNTLIVISVEATHHANFDYDPLRAWDDRQIVQSIARDIFLAPCPHFICKVPTMSGTSPSGVDFTTESII